MTIATSYIPDVTAATLNQIVRLISGLPGGPVGFRDSVEDWVTGLNNLYAQGSVAVTVANETGGPLAKGDLVYISAYDSASGYPEVAISDADAIGKPAMYVLLADIADGSQGQVAQVVTLRGIDTSGFTEDDLLFLSKTATTGNTITNTAPTGADVEQQPIGVCEVSSATAGVIRFDLAASVLQRVYASRIPMVDAGGAITATDVEGALQEAFLLARGSVYYGDAAGKLARADIKALGAGIFGNGTDASVVNILSSALGGTDFVTRAYSGATAGEPVDNSTLVAAIGSEMLARRAFLAAAIMDQTTPPTDVAGRGVVISGGLVEAQGVPDLTVRIQTATPVINQLGQYHAPGAVVSLGGFTIPAGGGEERRDAVVIDSTGTVVRRVGPEGAPTQAFATLSPGDVPLCQVLLTQGVDTEIQAGNISDLRETARAIDPDKILEGYLSSLVAGAEEVIVPTVGGLIAPTKHVVSVLTPAGAGAYNLDEITTSVAMQAGEWFALRIDDAANPCTIRDFAVGGGNIRTSRQASIVLASVHDLVLGFTDGTDAHIVAVTTQAGRASGADGAETIGTLFPLTLYGAWAVDGDGARTNGGGLVGQQTVLHAMGAAYCKVYDVGTTTWSDVSLSSALPNWTANYQLTADAANEEVGDLFAFGFDVPHPELATDLSQPATWGGDGMKYTYSDGPGSRADLAVAGAAGEGYDNTDTTANNGLRSLQQSGAITYEPPADWTADTIDGQLAYWIVGEITAAQVTQTPILNGVQHDTVTGEQGWRVPFAGSLTALIVNDAAAVVHTTQDVVFVLWDATSGEHRKFTWAQDLRRERITCTAWPLTTAARLFLYVLQEDGAAEPTVATIEAEYSISTTDHTHLM